MRARLPQVSEPPTSIILLVTGLVAGYALAVASGVAVPVTTTVVKTFTTTLLLTRTVTTTTTVYSTVTTTATKTVTTTVTRTATVTATVTRTVTRTVVVAARGLVIRSVEAEYRCILGVCALTSLKLHIENRGVEPVQVGSAIIVYGGEASLFKLSEPVVVPAGGDAWLNLTGSIIVGSKPSIVVVLLDPRGRVVTALEVQLPPRRS